MKYRKDLFTQLRQNTNWNDFINEIARWYPLALYKNSGFVSIYPEGSVSGPLVDPKVYDGVRQSLSSLDLNLEQDFFGQFQKLFLQTPKPHLHHFSGLENALYTNYTSNTKNAYLSFNTTGDCENVYYSLSTKINSKNIYYSIMSWIQCENVYQSVCVLRSSNVFFSSRIEDSFDVRYSDNLIGCQHCIRCSGLQNQQYCIDNQLVGKEEFEKSFEQLKSRDIEPLSPLRHSGGQSDFIILSSDYIHSFCSYNVHRAGNVVFSGHEDGLTNAYDTVFGSGGRDYAAVCAINGDSEGV